MAILAAPGRPAPMQQLGSGLLPTGIALILA